MLLQPTIKKFEKEILGYNKKPLSFEDLELICETEGIILLDHMNLHCEGLLISPLGSPPSIVLDKNLFPIGDKTFIGFHEYFHYRLHPGPIYYYSKSILGYEKIEKEADTLAMLAIIPTQCLIKDLSLGEDIGEKYNLSSKLVKKRLELLNKLKI